MFYIPYGIVNSTASVIAMNTAIGFFDLFDNRLELDIFSCSQHRNSFVVGSLVANSDLISIIHCLNVAYFLVILLEDPILFVHYWFC